MTCCTRILVITLLGIGAWQGPVSAQEEAPADSLMLEGDQEGTAFRSLTVEAENQVQIEFERPSLHVELDPLTAPGLDLGSAKDVLDRTVPDLVSPLLRSSAAVPTPYLGRPWLDGFRTGAVARFRPQLERVDRWRLLVADSSGQTVRVFEGKGKPPEEIAWDGRDEAGEPVFPGLVYSYVLEAHDRAGNKRNFVGDGFELAPYRLGGSESPTLLFSGQHLREAAGVPSTSYHALVLEAASWLNQVEDPERPIRVAVTARTFEQADALARQLTAELQALVVGSANRFLPLTDVRSEAPAVGVVRISCDS